MTTVIPTKADDGKCFTIIETGPPVIDAGHHGDPGAVTHGKLKTYSTDIGYAVNRIDDETFLVLAPEGPIRVRRVDAK